jgi:beta-lactam-binding protein with PASTA domain
MADAVRGATVAAAKRKLNAANCRAGKVVRRAGLGVAVGRVLRTSPAAGARKPNGTKVKLIVRI